MNQTVSKQICATLSKDLRKKYPRRSARIMVDDTVKVIRGEYKGLTGKVAKISTESNSIAIEGNKKEKLKGGKFDVKNTRIQVDGAQRAKKGGEKVETWFHPSKVKIMGLNLEDSRRMKKSKSKEVKDKTNEIKKEVKEGKEKQKVKVNKTETKK